MGRPIWFSLLVLLALTMLPVAVWLDLRDLSKASLNRQAVELNDMMTKIRSYYSSNVVSRILASNGVVTPSHNYREVDGGIPIPATLSIELGDVIGATDDNISYRFVSDMPFVGRADHNLDEFETSALRTLREERNPDAKVTRIAGSLFDRQIRMAVPIILEEGCVSCHNAHVLSPKTDWKVGDVRGIQSISLSEPIATNLFSFKYLLVYLLLAGTFGLVFAVLQWRQAMQFGQMNSELKEANSFLASISMKISKYLSPQVYKSIFSGARDAVIATERKKLTIFFSDIKDFANTSERLQPEELTRLLNEYFTEMAKIAHDHGATVDKFIGDAILAFFGDPETKGTAGDAQACVDMAIAMQRRMRDLNREWRRRGIETPFQARMGINTGYCNVGNFGSADRMDYTIIGAEANLAARLESIAEPGGIVMSYETYALAQNRIRARALAPITLKGISREIVPFVVEGIHDAAAGEAGIIERKTDHLQLHVELAGLEGTERDEVESALETALSEVRRRKPSSPG